jgi:hypothetical protein
MNESRGHYVVENKVYTERQIIYASAHIQKLKELTSQKYRVE